MHQCAAFDYGPSQAERPKALDLIAAGVASGSSFYIRHLDAPEPLVSLGTFLSTYRGGKAEPEKSRATMSGSPESKRRVAICAAVRTQESRKYVSGKPCPEAIIPGTGSTYIGLSIFSYAPDDSGHSGTGSSYIIEHRDIDMINMAGPLDPAKLPFTIETEATRDRHAIPIFVWFPRIFDPSKGPKTLTTKDLPDGTIIAYAVINEG